MGKQPQACVDRPPGAQAGGLLTEEGLEFGLWVQEAMAGGAGGGELCNCDNTATEKVTLQRSTASFLPLRRA